MKKLKAKPYCTFDELQQYIEGQVERLQTRDETLEIGFSKRTLQRDIKEIRNLYGVDIEYSKKEKGYSIAGSEMENMNFQRMMEAFDMFHSLNLARDAAPYILLEQRRPQGTEHLHGLLHAIKNRLEIKFMYHKFWEDEATPRSAAPYALKEFKNRWYVLARELKSGKVKCYGLDRLSELEITSRKFALPTDYSAEEYYRYCFGIIGADGAEPQDVILSFDAESGKYIKTLPLHGTQRLLVDNDDELRISLRIHITHDFLMEMLSHGESVKVLQPASLVVQVKAAHQRAWARYHSE